MSDLTEGPPMGHADPAAEELARQAPLSGPPLSEMRM